MSDLDAAMRTRLDAVLAAHARAQGVNPRDHGVVAIADLRALLAACDQAAPVLAAADHWADTDWDTDEGQEACEYLGVAVRAWRVAREG